jgi:hypothetical protein
VDFVFAPSPAARVFCFGQGSDEGPEKLTNASAGLQESSTVRSRAVRICRCYHRIEYHPKILLINPILTVISRELPCIPGCSLWHRTAHESVRGSVGLMSEWWHRPGALQYTPVMITPVTVWLSGKLTLVHLFVDSCLLPLLIRVMGRGAFEAGGTQWL